MSEQPLDYGKELSAWLPTLKTLATNNCDLTDIDWRETLAAAHYETITKLLSNDELIKHIVKVGSTLEKPGKPQGNALQKIKFYVAESAQAVSNYENKTQSQPTQQTILRSDLIKKLTGLVKKVRKLSVEIKNLGISDSVSSSSYLVIRTEAGNPDGFKLPGQGFIKAQPSSSPYLDELLNSFASKQEEEIHNIKRQIARQRVAGGIYIADEKLTKRLSSICNKYFGSHHPTLVMLIVSIATDSTADLSTIAKRINRQKR